MAGRKVKAAIEARIRAGWTRCPLVTPNTKGTTPKDGSPYLEVSYPISRNRTISVGAPGNNVIRESGTMRLVLYVARGAGTEEGEIWLEELGALFLNKEFDGVRTWEPSTPVFDDRNDLANYYGLSSSVEYQADFFG